MATPPMSPTSDQPPLTEKGKIDRTLVEADLLDDRYATTQRGLKNRYVQLMALGGTIGTRESARTLHYAKKSVADDVMIRSVRVDRSASGHWKSCVTAPRIYLHLGDGICSCHCNCRDRRIPARPRRHDELSQMIRIAKLGLCDGVSVLVLLGHFGSI